MAALVIAAGCAVRQPAAPARAAAPASPAVDVTALIRHGCFTCLEKALAAAEGEQAFEVAALLTLRAKELGLPYSGYRERAGTLAPADPRYLTYLQAIDAVPVDPLSGERYQPDSIVVAAATLADRGGTPPVRLPPVSERVSVWLGALRTGPGSAVFRRYVELAISCGAARGSDTAGPDAIPADADAPVLIYRVSACGQQPEQLRALRSGDPEFVDADFTLAKFALGARPADLDEALQHMQSAHEHFPASLAIATALGSVHEQREEWIEALAAYDNVLRQMPEHRDALLGRTVSLSRQRRHEEAIASATRMIELGAWFLGEAHYWRGWNEFSLQRYPEARVDADRAKTLMLNAAVFVLSGLIEWNERRLPGAETEFEAGLNMDFGRCDAAQYLGRVRVQRGRIPEALEAFRQAIQCFDLSITLRRKLVADIQAGPGSEATKARLAASHERAITAAIADRGECTQNIAALEKRGTR